jgi:hypothetical protein
MTTSRWLIAGTAVAGGVALAVTLGVKRPWGTAGKSAEAGKTADAQVEGRAVISEAELREAIINDTKRRAEMVKGLNALDPVERRSGEREKELKREASLVRGVASLQEGLTVTISEDAIRLSVDLPEPRPVMTSEYAREKSESLVRRTVEALMARGHDPHERGTFISAYIWQPIGQRSPTGRERKHGHGNAYYDPVADAIEWKAMER